MFNTAKLRPSSSLNWFRDDGRMKAWALEIHHMDINNNCLRWLHPWLPQNSKTSLPSPMCGKIHLFLWEGVDWLSLSSPPSDPAETESWRKPAEATGPNRTAALCCESLHHRKTYQCRKFCGAYTHMYTHTQSWCCEGQKRKIPLLPEKHQQTPRLGDNTGAQPKERSPKSSRQHSQLHSLEQALCHEQRDVSTPHPTQTPATC